MAFAGLVGLVLLAMTSGGLFCSTITRFSGANIAIGAKIALVGGIVGMLASLVASVLAPDSPRVLSWVLLLEAATLSIAIGYVARDSAISKQTQDCGLFRRPLLRSTSTASTHGRKRCDAPSLGATHSQRPPAGQSRCGWSSSSKRRLQEVGRAEEVRAAIALLSEASRPAR